MIEKSTLTFLKELTENNNREWFLLHKSTFLKAKENMEVFMDTIHSLLDTEDVIESHKVYRIYRDVRFSHDKTPYKTYFSGYFKRQGAERRGSYWIAIGPNNTQIGGGFYAPNKEDLLRLRKEFQLEEKNIHTIMNNEKFTQYFETLQGEGVKTAPKGFSKDLPNIELIKKKQFYAFRKFSDAEVLSGNFQKEAYQTLLAIRPFFDYMSQVLTTDLNGVSLIK